MFQALDDGAVVFSPSSEVYFGLNHVGAAIWELLPPATTSFEALCHAVRERYPDADPDRVAADAAALLDELAREGLVVAPPSDASRDGETPTDPTWGGGA